MPPRPFASARVRRVLVASALFAFGVALSSTALDAPFVLDDVSKIVQNPDIRELAALASKLVYPYTEFQVLERNDPSRPVVFATYALNYAFGGLSPRGYHLVNAACHALNGVFVFFLVMQWFRGGRKDAYAPPVAAEEPLRELGAALTAALFLASPMNAGTVLYVYGRSDVLGATFVLAAALLHLRARGWARAGAAMCFVLALFTKQSAIVLPALLVLVDLVTSVELSARAAWRRALWRAWPYAVVALAYVGYRFAYFGAVGDIEGRGQTWGTLSYASVQPWSILRYVQLALAPVGLALDHQILPETVSIAERALAAFALCGVGAAAFVAVRRFGRAGLLCVIGFAWFFLCLAPTSSVLPTVDALVERRAYLASAGLYFAVVVWLPRLAARTHLAMAGVAAAFALLLVFTALTLVRAHVHGDARRLWVDVIAKYPKSVRGTNNLANLLVEAGEYREALAAFERLMSWNAGDYIAHNNLGNLLAKPGTGLADETRAVREFETAIALNPGYAAPHYNLARIHQQRGDVAPAERHYLRALRIQPGYALAHSNLGLLYFHQGRRDDALARYVEALRLDPHCGPARHNLALLERTPPGALPNQAPRQTSAAPSQDAILAGRMPSPGAASVPVESVDSVVLTRLYEEALAKQPGNRAVRRKYADLCRARRLPCARPQYEALLAQDPNDAEARALLRSLSK